MLHLHKEAFDARTSKTPRRRFVIIGNGTSPGRALEQPFEAAPGAYKVTVFNAEPRVNYDRIMLSPVLSGEKSFEEIVICGDGWDLLHKVDRAAPTSRLRAASRRSRTIPVIKTVPATERALH